MKVIQFTFLIVGLFFGCVGFSEALELTIEPLPKGNASSTQIKISIANTSQDTEVVALLFYCEDHYVRFDVRDMQGLKLPFTGVEMKFRTSSKDYLSMVPGSSYSQVVDLSECYTFQSGSYTVRAIYELTKERRKEDFIWTGKLTSNQIQIEVPN